MVYIKRVLRFILLAAILLVLTQDIQIFPGMFRSVPDSVPMDVEQFFVDTEDGKKLEVLRMPGKKEGTLYGKSAILSHGNFETNYSSLPILKWLSELGFDSYVYDYRGYGNSSGWPSEEGLYIDSRAVWDRLVLDYNLKQDQTLLMGISIGTGISSRLARDRSPKCITLLSPYVDLKRVVNQNIAFRPLIPFLRYSLPTMTNLQALEGTNVVLAHGKLDNVIDFSNSEILYSFLKEKQKVEFIVSEKASHNDLLYYSWQEIENGILPCMK
jgi:esterase/lipase